MTTNTWNKALGGYVVALRAANRAPKTINLHRHYLAQLAREHASPWTVTLEDLRELMAARSWGAEARKSARMVFRGFYGWAEKAGLIAASPAVDLEPIKVPAAAPRPTPERLVRSLVSDVDRRIRFMGMLGAQLGMRCAEISVVHKNDWDGRRLLIHGKGGRTRLAFVLDTNLVSLLDAVDGWAFPGRNGHLTAGHVSRLLSRAMPDTWTGHTLRHRAATVAHEETGNILAVSVMLGHSQVTTTQRYTAVSDRAVLEVYRAAAA